MAQLGSTRVYGDLTVTGEVHADVGGGNFSKLAEVSSIDITSTGTTTLYNVGSSANVMVFRIDLLCTSASSAQGDAVFSVGTNSSDYDNIQASIKTVGLDTANEIFSINTEGIHTKAGNSSTITLNVTTADTGTTNTVTAILWGYEY